MHDAFINSKLYICICVQNIHIMFKCMYIQNNQNIYIYTQYISFIDLWCTEHLWYGTNLLHHFYIHLSLFGSCFGEKNCCWQTGPTRVASRNSVEGYQSIHSWHPWWTQKNRGVLWGHEVMVSYLLNIQRYAFKARISPASMVRNLRHSVILTPGWWRRETMGNPRCSVGSLSLAFL